MENNFTEGAVIDSLTLPSSKGTGIFSSQEV